MVRTVWSGKAINRFELEDKTRLEVPEEYFDALEEVPEDHSFTEHPATDVLHDESIARWPTISCSELGSKRIRLVRIIPGSPCSIIRCQVSKFSLEQAPCYSAISYTWGSPLGFREILIEGRPHSVAKNLWRFLDQSRRLPDLDSLAGWLWIDALSINQSEPREKLDQVGIISSIFQNAERVIVWLGSTYGNSDLALSAVCPNSKTKRPQKDLRTLAGPVWSALHSLCERPYWHRLWVYQELKSAQRAELMCGNRLTPLRLFQEHLFAPAAHRSEDKFDILRKSSAGMILRLIGRPAESSLSL
jgi:hypothetical protein